MLGNQLFCKTKNRRYFKKEAQTSRKSLSTFSSAQNSFVLLEETSCLALEEPSMIHAEYGCWYLALNIRTKTLNCRKRHPKSSSTKKIKGGACTWKRCMNLITYQMPKMRNITPYIWLKQLAKYTAKNHTKYAGQSHRLGNLTQKFGRQYSQTKRGPFGQQGNPKTLKSNNASKSLLAEDPRGTLCEKSTISVT